MDENNHALAALRYLVSRLDERLLGRRERRRPEQEDAAKEVERKERRWLSVRNELLWREAW